jgi:immune inhibitor A
MSAVGHRALMRACVVLSLVVMLVGGSLGQAAARSPGSNVSGSSAGSGSRAAAAKPAAAPAVHAKKSGSALKSRGAAVASSAHSATGFTFVKTADQVICQTIYTGGFLANFYTRGDCIRVDFTVTNTPASQLTAAVKGEFIGPDGGAPFLTVDAARRTGDDAWRIVTDTDSTASLTWPAGLITLRIQVVGDTGDAGEGTFYLNGLGATITPTPPPGAAYAPGDAIGVTGQIDELNDVGGNTVHTGVPAQFKIRVTDTNGTNLYTSPFQTAASNGSFSATIPGSATNALSADASTNFELTIGLEVIKATYTDPVSAAWGADPAGTGAVTLVSPPGTLLLDNNFTTSTGWVKPGDDYPFTVSVRNYTGTARNNIDVVIPAPDGTTFTGVKTLDAGSTATITGAGAVHWTRASLDAATPAGPGVSRIVVEAKADTRNQDAEIVWKDLSSTATLTYTGGPGGGITSQSRGPKVIPPTGDFESARYGNKPFPIVPMDFTDRKHSTAHSGEELNRVVNSTSFAGSTVNLYHEMSYGQLHPVGTVPSAGIGSAGWDYAPGFNFTQRDLASDCRGTTFGDTPDLIGSPLYGTRIEGGWYQAPGDTEYYGGDFPAFTAGPGSSHDEACGPVAKAVYDAAQIADPEINYNDYDSDKDGLVDFFMMVFVGLGGNGDSQLNGTPPYDNIWPHSYSLTAQYTDSATGLTGYITDDQLTDLEGTPQCWVGTGYTEHAACTANGGTGDDARPTYVRVGRYNVNPESAMDHTSVIAHEFGHYLGMPDLYSNDYSAYNDWNLMAGDYSQHMTVFGKQELGWVVPNFLQPNQTLNLTGWSEIKNDTGQITWQRPDGSFYTLSQANGNQNIHNGQVYGVKLPGRQLIDPAVVAAGASVPDLLYSGRGDNFGCPPSGGHNYDFKLPELASLPAGSPVKLTFQSSWDMEWAFDYGYVMVTTDGSSYTSLPSAKGYTATDNPNGISCQDSYSNGITGQSGAHQGGPAVVAAAQAPDSPTAYSNGAPFIQDEYDLSAYAGQSNVVLRFSYTTDEGVDRPGWFIDDVKVASGGTTLFSTDFSAEDQVREYSGGCNSFGQQSAAKCTVGWNRINTSAGSTKDHAYYIELRDRSGFDFNGRGQSDRGNIGWNPGVLIEYTDEVRGYGNTAGQPPRQHYIDSQPQPGFDCGDNLYEENPPDALTDPRCQDAAFTDSAGDSHFDDDPNGGADPGDWVDNFNDASSSDGLWHFNYNCLSLDVTSMSGAGGNSAALPSDLTTNATISTLAGCAPYVYPGGGPTPNTPPVAVAQARPNPTSPGVQVRFDGSASTDDKGADALTYQWDFTNDGTFDATGQTTLHAYATGGTYTARLKVTDADSASSETTIAIVIKKLPDLKVVGYRFKNVTVNGQHRVRVYVTVKNVGLIKAPKSKTIIRIDDKTVPDVGWVWTKALRPGQSTVVSKLWDARNVPGRHTVKMYADYNNKIVEISDRNRLWRKVTVTNGWT